MSAVPDDKYHADYGNASAVCNEKGNMKLLENSCRRILIPFVHNLIIELTVETRVSSYRPILSWLAITKYRDGSKDLTGGQNIHKSIHGVSVLAVKDYQFTTWRRST